MLADRIASAIGESFKIPPPPTIAARVAGGSEIAFSHFKSQDVQFGLSTPSPRQEAFVFNIPLISTRYPVVSIDGRRQSVIQDPGKAYLFDLSSKNEISLETAYNSVRFHIPQTAIDHMGYEKGLPRVGGLSAKFLGQDDLVLYNLALTILLAILKSTQVTTAFVEYIALAFHDHVVHTYGGVRKCGCAGMGGLAPWQIRRACDYIEANLVNDPSIAMLSQECGLSTSYFARAFRTSTGMTPHQWITRRRIERAKSLMAHTTESLAQISVMCGFVDQSHLGRHFLKQESTSPAQWRRRQSGRALFKSEDLEV
ncbi:helix-turn-helix transcriptional regulator [Azospirillum sp. YIM B02556]|uniref:Helix-turn-helix transcriptional regulator n=1 Tax=Azospirillum endophyticum TaxID=2800326 RepID=A0ABS1F7E0_9PROT|nr:helix-turn-helix transcriptional regulator [Azospirillum endophyticum]